MEEIANNRMQHINKPISGVLCKGDRTSLKFNDGLIRFTGLLHSKFNKHYMIGDFSY